MRFVSLGAHLVIGYLAGNIALGLALTVAKLTGHPPSGAMEVIIPVAGGVAGAGIGFLRWRMTTRAITSDVHGSARFGTAKQAKLTLGNTEGLIIGRASIGWLMRYDGPAHLVTIAPTRSGKGVGAIIPNLLTADRSVLCIDPKGENARITARARHGFGPVHVLDPFEATDLPCASFNPLDGLDASSVDVAEDAALIADALVYDPPQQISEAHWNEEAKALIAGLILHVVATLVPSMRTLQTVREILTTTPERFQARLGAMQGSTAVHGLVARAANRHLSKADREAASVLSAAQRHTHFLDTPRMARVLGRSDFSFTHLKTQVTSVFLVLPPDRLATHARWLRLMTVQALAELARSPKRPEKPVLLLLDEFAALGRLEAVERAFGLMAGYGLQLWAILQDLHQLRSAYGSAAGTFLSNAGLIQVFNVADVDTANWVSRMLGASTEVFYTSGSSMSQASGKWSTTRSRSTNLNLVKRDLMTPDEIMRLGADTLLLLRPGQAPVMAGKVRYFEDAEFRALFDAEA